MTQLQPITVIFTIP
jgi:multidrug efflux system membrane fusion protein